MPATLAFDGIRRGFGSLRVLRDVSGQVGPGEALLVQGANASGKSTLLRCLAGLLRPQHGTIRLDEGRGVLSADDRRLRVGWVAPDLAFYEALSAAENLVLFGRLRGLAPATALRHLETLGVPLERRSGALSSGMRQRLRWAFALMHEPCLLLLDEPFQNLDAESEGAVRSLLASHLSAGGLAVVATPIDLDLPGVAGRLVLEAPEARSGP